MDHLWLYKFDNCFLGPSYHGTWLVKRGNKTVNFVSFWSRLLYNQKELWTTSRERRHQKRQGAHVSLEIWLAGWRWDRSGGACCKDNPLSSHCVSSSAPGLKTTRLVTMKLLFQMTAPTGNRRLPVPIWSKYGVGWSRYAPPFFVFSTIDAPSKGHWVRVVNNVRCA